MIEDFFKEIRKLQRQINASFNNLWRRELPDYSTAYPTFRTPLTDIQETDDKIIATFEIPGVDKKDIQLNVTENRIEVKVEKKQEVKMEKGNYLKEERSYKGFYRAMPLPAEIIPEKTRASYKDGVLKVEMIKTKKEKKKQIPIE